VIQPSGYSADATYTYDPNGNLASKTEGTDTWVYTWNAENEPTKVEKNGVEVARFAYDPKGRRVEKIAAGVTTAYAFDAEDTLREIRGTTSVKYVHGPGIDEPLSTEAAAVWMYLHADGLASVVATTDSSGSVTLTRRYEVALATPDSHGVSLRTSILTKAGALTDYTFWGTQCTLSIGWTDGGNKLGGRWRYDVPSATLFADDETAEKVFPAAGRWQPRRRAEMR
jgi:YD repeat-containing protein